MGHYPLHFHEARYVPTDTFVKDSSINESMTRWIVLHSTQGVLLQRNIGYKSIGSGFFLENGTEVDNKFYSNLGIFARAAVNNPQNPRKIPGILGRPTTSPTATALPAAESTLSLSRPTSSIPRCSGSAMAGTTSSAIWRRAPGPAAPPIGSSRPRTTTCPTCRPRAISGSATRDEVDGLRLAAEHPDHDRIDAAEILLRQLRHLDDDLLPDRREHDALRRRRQSEQHHGQPARHFPGIAASRRLRRSPPLACSRTAACTIPMSAAAGARRPSARRRAAARDCTSLTGTPPSGGAAVAPCSNGPGEANCAVTVLDHFTSSFHWAETELLRHLAKAAMVPGRQQRPDGCPGRRPQLHHQRRLLPLLRHRGRLVGDAHQPARRAIPRRTMATARTAGRS